MKYKKALDGETHRRVLPHDHWRRRIDDMLEHIEMIEKFTKGKTEEDFYNDPVLTAAVERCLHIIGEASGGLPQKIKDKGRDIPWQELREMRNILVHGYDIIDQGVVWKTTGDMLQSLKKFLMKLKKRQKG